MQPARTHCVSWFQRGVGALVAVAAAVALPPQAGAASLLHAERAETRLLAVTLERVVERGSCRHTQFEPMVAVCEKRSLVSCTRVPLFRTRHVQVSNARRLVLGVDSTYSGRHGFGMDSSVLLMSTKRAAGSVTLKVDGERGCSRSYLFRVAGH